MAGTPKHSRFMRAYWDHFRVSTVIGSSNQDWARDEWEVPQIEGETEEDVKQYLPGKIRAGGSSLNGYMDVTEDTGWDVIENGFDGSIHYVARLPLGLGVGRPAIETQERDTGDSRAFDQGGGALLNWTGGGTGTWSYARQLTDGAVVVDTAAALDGVELAETTADEILVITIRVTDVTGTGSITFEVEGSEDDDDVDPYAQITGFEIAVTGDATAGTDDMTFTGPGVARLVLAGASEAFKRLVVSDITDLDDATVVATAGIAAPLD